MTGGVLAMAFVYLVAAVLFVPIAKHVGLGAVLGYLIAGVVIGPFALGFVGDEGHDVAHFAEFGVPMMLFLVGLELRPSLLWQLRKPIFGLGGAQVVLTAVVAAGIALAVGLAWQHAVAIGLILSMSSTAIDLATLGERGLLKTQGGQASFSVLLFQDIAVVPIFAAFPLLATVAVVATDAAHAGPDRPAWLQGVLVLGAVALIVVAGRFVVRPLFQFLATVKVRESFTAAALMIVVGIALLMSQVGLSAALGTFLAGVVLADSEYRHELETDLEPFKGLLLGLFFISIGAQIDFGLITSEPLVVGGIVVAAMAGKLLVLWILGRAFKLDRVARWTLAFSLAQVGEFAFVLITQAKADRIFGPAIAGPLVAATALSMALTPFLFIALERWVLPAVAAPEGEKPPHDVHDDGTPVVIAGYGRFGQMVGRILRANRIPVTILDLDPEMVEVVGRIGVKVYYGDASRVDLLHAAGCARARLFVCAVDGKEEATKIVENVRHHFPKLQVLARARDRQHYWTLRKLGAVKVFRETFASAYETGIESLIQLGYRPNTAHRLAARWRAHDERSIEELGTHWGTDTYFARARIAMDEAERLMREEDPTVYERRDGAWDNERLRADPADEFSTVPSHEPP